jgi:8-hydroxy-5-deazaflavin:NADPH oxidoreductase
MPELTTGEGSATAIIGIGTIGGTLARHLIHGDPSVLLASKDEAEAKALADELGPLARAASVEAVLAGAEAVVLALWLDAINEVVPENAGVFEGKVVIDPSPETTPTPSPR